MSRYVLSEIAQEDLVRIRDYYVEQAGQRVARKMISEFVEAFRFLGQNPNVGHKREDLAEDRPFLFWPMRDYLILYKQSAVPLQIVMIVRGSQDIPQILQKRTL